MNDDPTGQGPNQAAYLDKAPYLDWRLDRWKLALLLLLFVVLLAWAMLYS
jgi:hypothetical protein